MAIKRKTIQIDQLIQEFADCVIEQDKAIFVGDARTGNRFARRGHEAFMQLRAFGDRGRDALASLLFDPRENVRVAAACYLLRYRNAESLAVLMRAAKGVGLAALEAGEAIKRWREGAWNLDPPD
jgi:hypothetical protein